MWRIGGIDRPARLKPVWSKGRLGLSPRSATKILWLIGGIDRPAPLKPEC